MKYKPEDGFRPDTQYNFFAFKSQFYFPSFLCSWIAFDPSEKELAKTGHFLKSLAHLVSSQ